MLSLMTRGFARRRRSHALKSMINIAVGTESDAAGAADREWRKRTPGPDGGQRLFEGPGAGALPAGTFLGTDHCINYTHVGVAAAPRPSLPPCRGSRASCCTKSPSATRDGPRGSLAAADRAGAAQSHRQPTRRRGPSIVAPLPPLPGRCRRQVHRCRRQVHRRRRLEC